MSEWPIGLSSGCFYRTNFLDCVDAILAGGFSLLEVCSSPMHLDYHDTSAVRRAAEKMESLGISAYSFHAPFADRIDISSPDDEVRKASIDEVSRAAEAAAVLGARNFVIHPGPEHSEQPHGEERSCRLDHVIGSLTTIGSRCQALGLACVIENKLPHLLFGNARDMLLILEAISIDLGVCLDTGHAHLGGGIDHALRNFGEHLRMVHATDNEGSYDDHLPPGRGCIDWLEFLRALRANDFRGSIVLEIAGHGTVEEVLAGARQARHFLRRLALRV